MGKLRPEGVIVGLGVLGGTLGVEVGTMEIAICSEGEYSIVCTCFGSLCDSSLTIGRKLAELGSRPKGCQNDENHWPEASDAIFVHFKELPSIQVTPDGDLRDIGALEVPEGA